MDLSFLFNRLMRMTLREILFRINKTIQNELEQKLISFYNPSKTNINNNYCSLNISFPNQIPEVLINKADQLCDNRMDIFELKNFNIGEIINYNLDYKTGLTSPSDKFGKKIDYRDNKKIGDIKYIWEPNRHLFLLTLARAFSLSHDKKYLNKFDIYLSQWFDQNPFMIGINWGSSLELGIRLINWTLCWHHIKNDIETKLKKKWIESINQHCWFISRNLSAFSSANNHLIGEAAGLFIASSALPQFNKSKKWRNKSYKILIHECLFQNYSDGVNKEQAISYQQFTLDFLLLTGLIGKANNQDFPVEYWNRLEKMIEFISALEDRRGNIPQIGDEDDGFLFDFDQKEYGVYRSLLNTGAYIFNRSDFLKDNTNLDSKTLFLLSIGDYNSSKAPDKKKSTSFQFPDGGYYILGTNFNKKFEQKLIFDCGSMGFLSIASHGHADSLSFTFSADGYRIFIDPGTYAYHSNKKWRNYFRSTSAHNTLCVDGINQSLITGSFMWSKKAQSKLLEYQKNTLVKGTHDGYMRLSDKVRHTRKITYTRKKNSWTITDELLCNDEHEISLFFHCDPSCSVKENDIGYDIFFHGGICSLTMQTDMKTSIFFGQEDTLLGWHSPAYDVKIPTTTLKTSKIIKGNTTITTNFKIKFNFLDDSK